MSTMQLGIRARLDWIPDIRRPPPEPSAFAARVAAAFTPLPGSVRVLPKESPSERMLLVELLNITEQPVVDVSVLLVHGPLSWGTHGWVNFLRWYNSIPDTPEDRDERRLLPDQAARFVLQEAHIKPLLERNIPLMIMAMSEEREVFRINEATVAEFLRKTMRFRVV